MPPTILLTGQTGQQQVYSVYDSNVQWNSVAGCYVFLRHVAGQSTSVSSILYIGETDSLQRRMQEHSLDTWAKARALGATSIAVRLIANAAARQAEEEDLIRYYRPALNVRHNPLASYSPPATLLGMPVNRLLGR